MSFWFPKVPSLDLQKQRLESLSDGIYSVSLTLLVLDIRLPPVAASASEDEFLHQLYLLLPKLESWVISFALLMAFWIGLQRVMHRLKKVDNTLTYLIFLHLALVALAPFAVSLFGAYPNRAPAQYVYNGLMASFALTLIALMYHLDRHPQLYETPLARGRRLSVEIRMWTLFGSAVLATLVLHYTGNWTGVCYLPLLVMGRVSRIIEHRMDGPHEEAEAHA